MDRFIEQLVSKQAEKKDSLKRFGIMLGSIVLFLVSLYAVLLFPQLAVFLLALGAGAVFGAWLLIQNTFIEYEYIITNNEMDIDKIMAKKKRKRLITIKLDKAEEWGRYEEGKGQAGVTVEAHDCGFKNLWYIIVYHEKHGKTAVLFSPNVKVLDAVNKSVPHSLRKPELRDILKEEKD